MKGNIKIFNKKHRRLAYLLFILFSIYLLLVIFAKKIETYMSFPWVSYHVQELTWYVKTNIDFEEINIKDSKWNNINWIYLDKKSDKTIYYFHGNWGPISFFYSDILYLGELWYNVMAYDFPWYWKSWGFPYKEDIYEFSDVFYKYLKKEKNINDDNLSIVWYSIWTALATDFASKNDFDKLILISPLSSRYDMSSKILGFPLQKYLFLWDSFETYKKLRNIKNPLLIIHWNNDKIVPFSQWKKNFQNSLSPQKYFLELDNWGHNYILNSYWVALKGFISSFLDNWELERNYYFIDSREKLELEEKSRISFDLETDDSITKFVDNEVSFNDLSYLPEDLEYISSKYVYDTKWNLVLRSWANDAFQELAKSFYDTFWKQIVVVSAYRSYIYQKWIKDRWCPDNLCAKAWYSEHQSWLALDLWEASTQKDFLSKPNYKTYYNWLVENAYKYGFTNTYQKWLEIDGYEIEPWHWRYVWIPLATKLKELGMTFWEFYDL